MSHLPVFSLEAYKNAALSVSEISETEAAWH